MAREAKELQAGIAKPAAKPSAAWIMYSEAPILRVVILCPTMTVFPGEVIQSAK
jgi:hypothetical protein